MEQLRMYFEKDSVKDCSLPEGFSFEYFRGSAEEIADWVKICRQGLIGENGSEDDFRTTEVEMPGVVPERDIVFAVSEKGERAATTTFFIDPATGEGLLHMVCCREEFRGLGIGNAMVSLGLSELLSRGAKRVRLKTDDWRIPAIRAYERFGFVPDTEGEGMKERWDAIAEKIAAMKTEN